ncbi:hypothetical protein [Helicobacter suis]|uniref:hypothetical protein n=2 Tax=Helicobacter suis TaxID=104628 RepID=UPI0019677E8D|nr:hypothetical protein [Helicobacter suis]
MDLQEVFYQKVKVLFKDYINLMTPSFEEQIKQAICVLHYKHLWGACKEAKFLLDKKQRLREELFDAIMGIYSKRRNQHQSSFFLLQCFENALRSAMAISISRALNHKKDNWFLRYDYPYTYITKKADKAICQYNKKAKEPIDKYRCSTLDIFDLFTLGDLEEILDVYYPCFEWIFKEEKFYGGLVLPAFGTKEHVMKIIKRIRGARNEIFHNKPTHIKFKRDVEILLLRLGYNLKKASKIVNVRDFLNLKF